MAVYFAMAVWCLDCRCWHLALYEPPPARFAVPLLPHPIMLEGWAAD